MTDGLPNPRRALAFLTLAIAMTMAVLDGAIVNVALPTIAIRHVGHAGACDLGGQRLSARDHGLIAAARDARRHHGLSQGLWRRPRDFHDRLGRMRAVDVSECVDDGPVGSGAGRGEHDERQYRVRALHLSQGPTRARRRQHGGGGGDRRRGGAVRRGGDSLCRALALVVLRQRAARCHSNRARGAHVAEDAEAGSSARPARASYSTPRHSAC